MKQKKWTMEALRAVQERHEDWLMEQPGVCGVGISNEGNESLCLQVLTHRIDESVRKSIVSRLHGVPILLTESGPIEAL